MTEALYDTDSMTWDRSAKSRPPAEDSNPPSDESLLAAYRETGDAEYFEELVSRYERELYNYLRRYLGDADLAEDCFQTTFLQVHLKADQFDASRRFRPWLYTVATNQAIDAGRRNKRHQAVSLDRPRGNDEALGQLVNVLESEEVNPLSQTEAAEEQTALREVVDALPETYRQVVILLYYQGLKYREAADILGIPVGTVKSRMHTALEKIQSGLGSLET